MRPRGATGVWELFVPGVGVGTRYKYRILNARGEHHDKADPCGRAVELRPATASEVWAEDRYAWDDASWMEARASVDLDTEPMSVYEVHLGSWRVRPVEERAEEDAHGWLGYRELADQLLPYVKELGFTHLELLPVLEHPLDQSWGYQPLGFFAPTSRFGDPDDFRYLVDRAHQLGLGVLLDWVPGHFPTDGHGLVDFDGTPLYEHPDPLQAHHPDWGTLVFDYGKPAVRSFLVSSALHWLEDYHLDGLRVDAVASMLYLDYSRPEGMWRPNREGGRENLEAVELLKAVNDAVHQEVPGAIVVAEESTSWPRVSHGTDRGGLGFDQKWNMGWMNDTLDAMAADPVHRRWKYDRFTFSILYAFTERFVLPLSHDEVVHGKGSLLGKMPGSHDEKFANLRLLLSFQWAHPGKKLLFMGGELAQWDEWNVDGELDWALEGWEKHAGVQLLVGDLNRLYRSEAAFHRQDFRPEGFEWVDCHDAERTILAFLRWAPAWEDFVQVVGNFTPVHRDGYLLPVPFEGRYRVIFNSDAPEYGGRGAIVPPVVESRPMKHKGRNHVVELPLPGLSMLFLKREGEADAGGGGVES
jgi:1,4-alpha-glucan branching enzyme